MTNAWDSGFVLATASLIVFAVCTVAWLLRKQ